MEGHSESIQKGQNKGKISPVDIEGKVFEHFVEKHYNIALGRWYEKGSNGTPDFLLEKENKKLWIEAKSSVGSLAVVQIEWMAKNNQEEIYLAIEKNFHQGFDLFKIDVKKVDLNAF